MSDFVLLFRQGERQLSADEQRQRTDDVRTWAQQQIADGRTLDPRMLSDHVASANGSSSSTAERPVIALLFLDARDVDDALAVANTHPGLRYGSSIEVRAWTSPIAARS